MELTELGQIRAWLDSAIAGAQDRSRLFPSRELSLVITKLQEARLWLNQVEDDE